MDRTILVVDDSPVQAIMLRRVLTQAGFQVVTAKSGFEGLEFIKKQPIDLIISDVNMPKMDGYEFCHLVKSDVQMKHIPLILCTTLADSTNLIKGIEVGADNYITHPWNEEHLLALVDDLLKAPPRAESQEQVEEVIFNNQSYKIRTSRQYILNFLLSTYQNIHEQNLELTQLREEIQKAYSQLSSIQKEQEQILLNIFPETVAQELIAYGSVNPMRYEEALGFYFERFDEIIEKRRLERIKTIGDGYMCVGGIPVPNTTHAIDCVLAALDIQKFVRETATHIQSQYQVSWKVRIGIHTGPLVAGVIGKKRLAYDIWGETVNLASRIEMYSDPDKINISSETYERIKDYFICQPRGSIKVRNKAGIEELFIDMYFVEGIKPHVNLALL